MTLSKHPYWCIRPLVVFKSLKIPLSLTDFVTQEMRLLPLSVLVVSVLGLENDHSPVFESIGPCSERSAECIRKDKAEQCFVDQAIKKIFKGNGVRSGKNVFC